MPGFFVCDSLEVIISCPFAGKQIIWIQSAEENTNIVDSHYRDIPIT